MLENTGGSCLSAIKPGRRQVLPVRSRQVCAFSPVRSYSTTSLPRLLGTWWEGGGKRNFCYSVQFSSSYLPTLFVCKWLRPWSLLQLRLSQPAGEPDKFPGCAQGSEEQPAQAGWAAALLGSRLGKNPHELSLPFSHLGSDFLFWGPEIYLIKIRTYMPN